LKKRDKAFLSVLEQFQALKRFKTVENAFSRFANVENALKRLKTMRNALKLLVTVLGKLDKA
jgi:hypothetical protein